MNKKTIIEAGKNLLIVALTCSALWLVGQSPLFGQLPDALEGVQAEQVGTPELSVKSGSAAMPLRMAVMSQGGCCVVQHTDQALRELFSQVAPVLREVLSAAGEPTAVEQEQWQAALVTAPGVFLDFQTGIPLPVLTHWLSDRSNPRLTASVRYLLLSGGENDVKLYYRNEEDGGFYRCSTPSVSADYLKSIAEQTEPNGAIFAYQSDHYRMVAPYTIIGARTPAPREFSVVNPLEQEGGRLEELLERLSFPVGITTVYDTPEGRRARSGNDTLTISDTGTVVYDGQEERYPLTQSPNVLVSVVDGARELVCSVLEPWCGQARIYLAQVEELGQGRWRVCFGYALDNIPVHVGESGYAAQVLVEQGLIRNMELQLCSYTAQDGVTLLLPARQAAAILSGNGQQGSGLELCYQQTGETAKAGWIAGE